MSDVALMILPDTTGSANEWPNILVEQAGMWRGMPDLETRAGKSKKEIVDSLRTTLQQVMKQVADTAPGLPPNQWTGFGSYAQGLYRNLIPTHIHEVLHRALQWVVPNTPVLRLHIHPRADWIPWELLHDDKDFLGLRFQIARLPIVERGPQLNGGQVRQVRHIYNLLAESVLVDPPLQAEWQQTFAAAVNQVTRLPGNFTPTADWPVLQTLADAADADILHLTCHGGYQDDDGTYWTLNDSKDSPFIHRLRVGIIRTQMGWLHNVKPLVFGNACASAAAAGGAAPGGNNPILATEGLSTAFFSEGALAFVGTFAPVSKRLAVNFASRFYQHLLVQGEPIGQALWATKQEYAQANPRDNDPSWLFYCLYGPPETQFQLV
jgi:CHAT domain